jgi:hypothetical protein
MKPVMMKVFIAGLMMNCKKMSVPLWPTMYVDIRIVRLPKDRTSAVWTIASGFPRMVRVLNHLRRTCSRWEIPVWINL